MNDSTAIETKRVRELAGVVLDRLLVDRVECEIRLAEHDQRDPLKAVTGRSAMDNAVITTRDMIGRMDAMLASFAPGERSVERRRDEALGVVAAGARS